jgi:CTP:molybdopterin cytidylyltransferase MocA
MRKPAESCTGLILAGGAGLRWGGPKALALLPDGRSFLECCFDLLRAAGVESVWATLPPDLPSPLIPGLRAIRLPEGDLAMLASVRAGLALILKDTLCQGIVLHPVDHPLVRAETIRALLSVPSLDAVAVPSFGGRGGHPIRLPRPIASGIVDGSLAGPTLRDLLRLVSTVKVDCFDAGILANCNTPDSLAEWMTRLAPDGDTPMGR